jgi:integrase
MMRRTSSWSRSRGDSGPQSSRPRFAIQLSEKVDERARVQRDANLMAAFVGMRPAELYGLRWADVDLRNDEIRVARQYSKATRTFELPKNGKRRDIALTGPAKAALMEMPRPLDADELIFRASRGAPITGRVQHYYWHPVRCRFGKPSLDFYELRHFCASWLFNDLELPARERIKRATGGKPARVTDLSEAKQRQEP